MAQLSQSQAIGLYRILSQHGFDTNSLKAANPFDPEFSTTPTGKRIRTVVEAMSPQLAADLKREAGHEDAIPSLAMAAAMAEGTKPEDLTGKLADEFKLNNPDQARKLQKDEDERLLGWLDNQTEKSQRRRMGDDKFEQLAEVNRQRQAAMDESRVRASELQTRIRERQAAERRMRPSLLN